MRYLHQISTSFLFIGFYRGGTYSRGVFRGGHHRWNTVYGVILIKYIIILLTVFGAAAGFDVTTSVRTICADATDVDPPVLAALPYR